MTEHDILRLLEVQYLKGRIDELQKAIPTVTNIDRSRKLDQRLQKYYNKLKNVDEVAYYLYQVESINREHSKRKGIQEIADLLREVEKSLDNDVLRIKINQQLKRYDRYGDND